jgi:hypothetical protein
MENSLLITCTYFTKECQKATHHHDTTKTCIQVISPLFLHDFCNVSLFETKASIEKAIGSVAEPFSNAYLANKELVARLLIGVEMLYLTMNNVSYDY